jgi:hypothetical protein
MFTFKRTALALALASFGLASGAAHALTVTAMFIADTIDSNTSSAVTPVHGAGDIGAACATCAGPDGLGTDGASGAFRFATINLDTYQGANFWYGDLNGGVINMAGGAPLNFSTGFIFAGAPFEPFNSGAITGSTSAAADSAAVGTVLSASDLSINIAGWAGYYTSANFTFNLTPDAGTLVVDNFIKTSAYTYAYRLHFQHDITSADDPSGAYTAFTARWVLEGTMVTFLPEASTYGMMLAGLGLVGVAARRRRNKSK